MFRAFFFARCMPGRFIQLSYVASIHAGCDGVLSQFRARSQCNSSDLVWHKGGMAKPPAIEDKQIEHLLKATASYSYVPERDTAMLLTLYGTALAVTELATIKISSYLKPDGSVFVTSVVRSQTSHTTAMSDRCSGPTSESPRPWTSTCTGGSCTGKAPLPNEAHTVA